MCREESGVAEDVEYIFGGGYKKRFALTHFDAIDVSFAPEAHHHDEGVTMEVDLLSNLNDDAMDDEVWAVDQLRGRLCAVVGGAILRPYLIVDGIFGLFDMQFARLAVGILSAEVIDTIGDI